MYVGQGTGNFDNGKLYVARRKNSTSTRERDMVVGQTYPIEFVEITNATTRPAAEFNSESRRLNALLFGRVEDIDYRKGSDAAARELYFCVTGQAWGGNRNANNDRTMYGRVYRLMLDANNPLEGTLEVIFDGDDINVLPASS
jgi:secreted PhoX family phosphatase